VALTLQQIIDEALSMIQNEYGTATQVSWLNNINQDFFNVVKIPQSVFFTSVSGQKTYTLSGTELREKNMDKVILGRLKYDSLNYQDVQPGHNWFTFNDSSKVLTLSSAPSSSSVQGLVRYHRSATTNLTSTAQTPDAPPEYHYIYVLGLCQYIAEAQNDMEQSSNYGQQYRQALNIAAQNYQGRETA
jgi:hypothetical protein